MKPTEIQIHCAFTEMVALEKINANPKNINRHPPIQIELFTKILKKSGFRRPIIVSKRSGFVTRGHGLLMACMKLGLKEAPVEYQEYKTEAKEIEDMLADNELARHSYTEHHELAAILSELDAQLGGDLEAVGLSEEDIKALLDPTIVQGMSNEMDDKSTLVKCPHCGEEFKAPPAKIKKN